MLNKEALSVFSRTADALAEMWADKEMDKATKSESQLGTLRDAFLETGQIFIVGEVPVHVLKNGQLTTVLPKSRHLDEILIACGIMPELSGNVDKALFRFLLASNFPENEIIKLSKYLPAEHVLLLNEFGDTYLRMSASGTTRHVNGEGGFLFEKGKVPHTTDLEAVNGYQGPAFAWTEDSPLIRHVFGVGVFSQSSGVGRQVAMSILIAWTLAGLLYELVKAHPILHLHGLSGTRKTAVATALGWVISPEGTEFHVVAAPDDRKQMETTLICASGLLCLDEANNLRTLFSLLKAIITNAIIELRILYTTANIQRFTVRLLCILTTNTSELFEEAIALRVLKLDMGDPRGQEVTYRSDASVEREWREGNLREVCWLDLVCRLSAAMRLLAQARSKGEDGPPVRFRMSGFWVPVLAIAQQEGAEVLSQMTAAADAVEGEQRRSVNTADDLLPLLQSWLETHPERQKCDLSASEIGASLLRNSMKVSASMEKLLGSALMLSNKLAGSSAYIQLLGMEIVNGKRTRKFRFDLSKIKPEDAEPGRHTGVVLHESSPEPAVPAAEPELGDK